MDFKNFFSFTKQERHGIITFLIVSAIAISTFRFWPYTKSQPPQIINDYYFDTLSGIETNAGYTDDISDLMDDTRERSKSIKKQKFLFNPNDISFDSLLLLGFSKFGAKSLVNYVSKGGVIYSKEKFKNIYGIDPKIIDELDGMITYPERKSYQPEKQNTPEKLIVKESTKPIKIIELNSADSTELVTIKGIGPFTAFKILQMRKRTGGFLSIDQLIELKVMSDSMFQNIKNQITINPELIKKININAADYKTFVTHPYFSSETAYAIQKTTW